MAAASLRPFSLGTKINKRLVVGNTTSPSGYFSRPFRLVEEKAL